MYWIKQLFHEHPDIVKHAKQHKAYTLKHIAEVLAKQNKYGPAVYYAKEALLTGFTIKWLLYSAWLLIKSIGSSSKH